MAEKATVLRWMIFRKRCFTIRIVALFAEFFRLFFAHAEKTLMVIVMGNKGGGFRRGIPQEKENTSAKNEEDNVKKDGFFLFAIGWHKTLSCC